MNKFILILSIFYSSLAFAQGPRTFQYFKVVGENGIGINNAAVTPLYKGISYFSDKHGQISISVDSVNAKRDFIFSGPGFNPKFLSPELDLQDTIIVKLDEYKKVERSADLRLKGFELMTPIFLSSHKKTVNIRNQILQKRIMYLNSVPIDIKGVSGRIIPSVSDTGMVLSSLRWSDVHYSNANLYQEEVLSRIDSGLFKILGELSSFDMIWDMQTKTINVNPLSNLEYPSPIVQKNNLKYHYYLADSVLIKDDFYYYRVDFEPTKEYSPLFHGDIWYDKQNERIVESHFKLNRENQINYTDSLEIHFYVNRSISSKDGGSQHTEVWLNMLNYKLKLDVNTLLLNQLNQLDSVPFSDKFRVLQYSGHQLKDTLDYFYSYINGNSDILLDLGEQPDFKSKDYKLRSIIDDKSNFARSFFLTGANYHFGKGYLEMIPFFMANGFNTVEGWYFNYRSTYHYKGAQEMTK